MNEAGKTKHYDLEDRTFAFAERVRRLVEETPKTISNKERAYAESMNLSRGRSGLKEKFSPQRHEVHEGRFQDESFAASLTFVNSVP